MVTVVGGFDLNVIYMVRFRCFVYSNGLAHVTLQLMNDLCKDTPTPSTQRHTPVSECHYLTAAML